MFANFIDVIALACAVLLFSTVAGFGLVVGGYFATRMYPWAVSVQVARDDKDEEGDES
jgi:hypothetical protein